MSFINTNLRFLRRQKGLTQEELAEKLGITRSSLGAYEEGRAEPKIGLLRTMAQFFSIGVDALIGDEMNAPVNNQSQTGVDTEGKNLRVLAITVDSQNRENIELVPIKAAAGYLNGYADPEYIADLPRFRLPVLPSGTTYRAFEITGDSMLPLSGGTIIIGEYIDNWKLLKSGTPCVVITRNEGIVFKRVENFLSVGAHFTLRSDNPMYPPYNVETGEVLEIWKARAFISTDFPDGDMTLQKLANVVMDLQRDVRRMEKK